MTNYLITNKDPRETDEEMKRLNAPYYAEKDKNHMPGEEAQKELNLEEEYSYIK